MDSDLVSELRDWANTDFAASRLARPAADEIERLTAAVEAEKALADKLAHAIFLLRTRGNTGANFFADEAQDEHREARSE